MKVLDRLLRYASVFQILARSFGRPRLAPELVFPPLKRTLIELDDLIRFAFARFEPAVINQLWQRHAGFLSHNLDGFRKSNPLDFHDEVENRAAFLATETIKNLFRGIDREGRLCLFVKGTARDPVSTRLLQRHIVLHDAD